jgi:hypothetical protein
MNLDNSDLAAMTERTLGPLEKQVNQFSLKAAGEGWKTFKRIMGTVTEPFFRKGMGERYYAYGAYGVGIVIWIMTGLASTQFASHASIAAILTLYKPFHFMEFIFQVWYFPLLVGLVMAYIQGRVGIRNIREALRLQKTGVPHHSRSRGAAVWRNEGFAYVLIELVLAFFNWPMAVLFGIGYGMNQMLKSAQNAAVRERYLDAMDKEIENKYLKDTALGNQPPEMAFLYHQIDTTINQDVREKMASALVGEPISIVAKPPQKKTPPQSQQKTETSPQPAAADPSAAKAKTESEWAEREREFVSENPPEPVKTSGVKNAGDKIILTPEMEAQFRRLWNLGQLIRKVVIVGLMILICAVVLLPIIYTIKHVSFGSRPSETQGRGNSPQTIPASVKPAASATISKESKQLIDQASSVLDAETQVLLDFKASCEATLNQDSTKSDSFSKQMEFAHLQAELKKVFDGQSDFLKGLQNRLRLAGVTATKVTAQDILDRLEKTSATRSEQRGDIYEQVWKFDGDLKKMAENARPQSSGNSAMDLFGK